MEVKENTEVTFARVNNILDSRDAADSDGRLRSDTAAHREERRLVRKLDARIMPLICCIYLFSYLDRINLGNARLQGLPHDVLGGDPTGVLFDWVNSAFYFPYVLCPVPMVILSKLCPPRAWFGGVALCWGVVAVLMATAFNFPSLLIARIVLGIFEAGFSPAVPLYLSLFYTQTEFGLRLATYTGFAGVAGACGGFVAFAIQTARLPARVAHWRILFVAEGVPSVLLGVAALALLPNRPDETRFLSREERAMALERVNRGARADVGRVVNREHIWAAFKDPRVYAAGVLYFAANAAFGSISAFLPTIITTFGFTDALAQLLTIPPYVVGSAVLCASAYASDRLGTRGIFVIAGSSIAGSGYILLLTVTGNNHVRYFATFCVTSGTYAMLGAILAWFSHNLGSESKKAAGIPLYMAIGQCGAVLGSHLYPLTDGPRYITGFATNCALDFLAAALAVVLTITYRRENARRDAKYGRPDPRAMVDTSVLGDKAPDFRYTP